MPIRPIDIMKSSEVSQYKQLQNNRAQHEQLQLSKNFQDLVQAETSKATETTKSENKEFRYDAKDKGRNSYSGNNKKKPNKDKKDDKGFDKDNSDGSGGIDILV